MTAARKPVHLPALDGMRALAAFAVLATHAGFNSGRSLDDGAFAPLLARLDFGVTVFFLLSGFLLYQPFVGAAIHDHRAPSIGSFYLRRALRILPAYWIAVIVTLTWLSARAADGGDYVSYLLLIQTYNHHNVDPSLTQMWTLAVEIAFYALLPWIAYIARGKWRGPTFAIRRQVVILIGLVLIAVAANVVGHSTSERGLDSLIWLPANLDWFALGMALALLSTVLRAQEHSTPFTQAVRDVAAAPVTCWVIGALLFWIATLPLGGPRNLLLPSAWEWTIKHSIYGLAALALLLPLMIGSGGVIGRALACRPMRILGELSYGVYLWHLPLLLAIQRGLGYPTFGGHFWLLFSLTAVTATVVAAVSWYGIERRLLRLGRRRRQVDSGIDHNAAVTTLSQQSS
jgi:peptidoglycan/LPS O-acetylase OafA/YrhL